MLKEDYYNWVRVFNFWNNNYIEYESIGDRNKNLSVKEHLNEIIPYLGDMIINLQNIDKWKIQLTIEINFISSNNVEEEGVKLLKSNNI